MDSAISRASQTILNTQKQLRRKIDNHFYEEEFITNNRNKHSAVKIPNDKIIDAIIGSNANAKRTSHYHEQSHHRARAQSVVGDSLYV